MQNFIRMIGCKMSCQGICGKCGLPRNKGNHQSCDRWPSAHGCSKGFHYVSNSKESTLEDLQAIVAAICSGEHPLTPVRFDLRIMQTANLPDDAPAASPTPLQLSRSWLNRLLAADIRDIFQVREQIRKEMSQP